MLNLIFKMLKSPSLVCFLSLFSIFACQSSSPIAENQIRAICRDLEQRCDPSCSDRKFRSCYIDSQMFPGSEHDLFKHCYAVHVGNTCAPCQQSFSLSFGGSMREVSCEEFQRSLARKNKDCNDCLKRFGSN